METVEKIHIDKSEIKNLEFSQDDALRTIDERKIRSWKLDRALRVGNNYKTHVNLIFQDKHANIYSTELTVWAITNERVVLKGTMMVPISSVLDVEGV